MKKFNTDYRLQNTEYRLQTTEYRYSRFARKGFTLMELLLYSGILIISAGLIGGIVYTVSKANLKTQAENEVNNQMSLLEEIFRQKIEAAKGINTISGSLLELNMGNSTSTFSLGASDNTIYLQEGGGSQIALNDPNKVKVTSLLFTPTGALGTQISNTYHYAWSENIGWIDFAYPGGNVKVPIGAGDLNGGAYVLSTGTWIALNCQFIDCCSTSNFKVTSDSNGNLSGWAWSESFGWISFSSTTDGSTVNYGVKIATTTTSNYQAGEWDGYAWSENIGWISFNCKTGGNNQTDVCATSNYKVLDLRSSKTGVKIDITLQYNSNHPEQQITRTASYVFNIITPSK